MNVRRQFEWSVIVNSPWTATRTLVQPASALCAIYRLDHYSICKCKNRGKSGDCCELMFCNLQEKTEQNQESRWRFVSPMEIQGTLESTVRL
jgi:hypothetical protein